MIRVSGFVYMVMTAELGDTWRPGDICSQHSNHNFQCEEVFSAAQMGHVPGNKPLVFERQIAWRYQEGLSDIRKVCLILSKEANSFWVSRVKQFEMAQYNSGKKRAQIRVVIMQFNQSETKGKGFYG